MDIEDIFQKSSYTEKDFRIDTAIMMYHRKIISLPRAVKLSGISKDAFNKILQGRNIETEEEKKLTPVEKMLNRMDPDDPIRKSYKPIRKGVTLEDIMREQNYKKIDWDEMNARAKALDIQEPLEVLLAQLKE